MNPESTNNSALDQSVILEAQRVSMVFPGTVALDSADFAVRRSSVTALVGENGAGKSTLMKIIAGIYQPDAGEIRLRGKPVVFDTPLAALQSGVRRV